jgi:hypothetical protein
MNTILIESMILILKSKTYFESLLAKALYYIIFRLRTFSQDFVYLKPKYLHMHHM